MQSLKQPRRLAFLVTLTTVLLFAVNQANAATIIFDPGTPSDIANGGSLASILQAGGNSKRKVPASQITCRPAVVALKTRFASLGRDSTMGTEENSDFMIRGLARFFR